MKRIALYLFAGMLCLSGSAGAQAKLWTLEECIRHAIEHNIELKQIELEQESREIELNTNKNSWLPNLNASVSQNFSFGRMQGYDNITTSRSGTTTSLSANTQMPLFDGFKIYNNIETAKLNLKAAVASLEKAKEDLAINVASYFLDVLYYKEILSIAELQVVLTDEQVSKTEVLVNSGKIPTSQLYDIKAQLANDEVSLAEARNNVNLALLNLAQALELERLGKDFDVSIPDIKDPVSENLQSLLPPDFIYDKAVVIKPKIKEQEYLLESQKRQLKVAQSDYYPSLSLGGSLSSRYDKIFSGRKEGESEYSFGRQLNDNFQQGVGLSLSIPIFNRFQVRNNVRSARVAIINRELRMESSKKELYKEIQQAYFSATAAQEKYIAAGKSAEASKEAFVYAEERYAAGKSTVFEYNESKTKYSQSLAEQAQSKYSFIFRAKILDFYNGIPITL